MRTPGSLNERKRLRAPVQHRKRCKVCQSPDRIDIEMDYRHFIPLSTMELRYGISKQIIQHHAIALRLDLQRDRKTFYNNMLSDYNPSKVTAENAIEAAKQLDRIERVIQDNPAPSQIVVQYAWGKALELRPANQLEPEELNARLTDDTNRVHSPDNTGEVPPLEKAI